ncbi:MAG: helix-turn-helix domain-containing protein [Peptostreptococcaceae bacterium]
MENLKIGDTIRRLRRDKSMTQDDLAKYIGVSIPAISKWESGISYPDITTLPILANLFEVTIDNLLNYKPDLDDIEIIEIVKECEMLIVKSDIDAYLNLYRRYMKRYPSNYKLHYGLIGIHTLIYVKSNDEILKLKLLEESIRVLENSIKNTNDMEVKEASLTLLSSQYLLKEDADKAEETIKKIYKPTCNPNIVLPIIYTQQGKIEEARKLMQENLQNALIEAIGTSLALGSNYYKYDDEKDLKYIDFDKAEKYFELSIAIKKIFEEERMAHTSYMSLAHIQLQKGNEEKCIKYLNKMMDIIREYNLNEFIYPNSKWCFDRLESIDVDTNAYDAYAMIIMDLKKDFEKIKSDERFINILSEIMNLQNKYNR